MITQGATLSKVMTSVTRIPDLGLSTLGLIPTCSDERERADRNGRVRRDLQYS